MNLPPDLEREIEAAAMKYSDEQFAIAESRTVATYCNNETFELAYTLGAEKGASLMLKRILADLRSEGAEVFYYSKTMDKLVLSNGPKRWTAWLETASPGAVVKEDGNE